jgi:hypothetical protein
VINKFVKEEIIKTLIEKRPELKQDSIEEAIKLLDNEADILNKLIKQAEISSQGAFYLSSLIMSDFLVMMMERASEKEQEIGKIVLAGIISATCTIVQAEVDRIKNLN